MNTFTHTQPPAGFQFQLPGDAKFNSVLQTLLAAPAAAEVLKRIENEAALIVRSNTKQARGDDWAYAAADTYSVAGELADAQQLTQDEYIVATHVLRQVRTRSNCMACTPHGVELLRALLLKNSAVVVRLAAKQQELAFAA